MKTIYISLPITGHDINERKREAERLRQLALSQVEGATTVVTPFDIQPTAEATYGTFMGIDIEFIIDQADTVVFASRWAKSKGCRLEFACATVYDKEICFESDGVII